MECIIIPDKRDSDCTSIIGIYMSPLYIVTPRSSLIDITPLSYDKIVSYIPPSSRLRMIEVDSSKEGFIISILHQIFCCMMDDDSIYFFGTLYRPNEFIFALISNYRLHRVYIRIEQSKRIILSIRFNPSFILKGCFFYDSRSFSSKNPVIDTLLAGIRRYISK